MIVGEMLLRTVEAFDLVRLNTLDVKEANERKKAKEDGKSERRCPPEECSNETGGGATSCS